MNRNITLQLISAAVLAVLGFLLVNPLNLWMPDMAHELMLALAVVVFAVFGVFVVSEQGGDERENAHRAFAGRAAVFAGGCVLLVAIIVESLAGDPDPWLVFAFVAMVLAKAGARMFASWKW